MKYIIYLLIFVTTPLFGFYVGVGYSLNTIDENFTSDIRTNEDKSGQDRYNASSNRFAPVIQIGHRFYLCNDWVFGVLAQWKYLNYKTANENSSRGQILPNATFSSINIFGPEVLRDFTSKTRLNNEVMLLGYIGKEILQGNAYISLGPAFLTASNSIYVSSVHTPNGVGDHLISTSVKRQKTMWGGAIQAGYEYFLNSFSFLNISYTYLQTGKYHFNNTVNTAILNGADIPGPTTLSLKRSIKFTIQQLIISMNLLF